MLLYMIRCLSQGLPGVTARHSCVTVVLIGNCPTVSCLHNDTIPSKQHLNNQHSSSAHYSTTPLLVIISITLIGEEKILGSSDTTTTLCGVGGGAGSVC